MFGLLTLLVLCFGAPPQSTATAGVTPEQFRAWFDAARQGKLEIPDEDCRNACNNR